ncbi:MAG: hypothetical protein ACO1N0_03710 [Fluviicola sp.]
MKAIALILCAAGLSLVATSCKKTYSCSCTETYQDASVDYEGTDIYPIVAKKKDKQSECDKYATGVYKTYDESVRTCTAN